jgi:copper(I)-binding protein
MGIGHAQWATPLGAAALAVAIVAGCSTDDADSESSNRGGGESSGQTSVNNAFIVPAYTLSCVLQVDAPAQLTFTAVNGSTTESETLSDISTPAASTVSIDASKAQLEIAPGTSIAAGQPVQNLEESTAPDEPFTVTLQGLEQGVEPGKSFPVTFAFEREGDITFNVAVEACPAT